MQCSNVNTHSSKFVILLECLNDQPMSRVLTDSLILAYAMYEKTSFSKQFFLFSKLYYRSISKSMGLPSEANVLDNLPKQSWSSSEMICCTVSQPHSPKIHPMKFLSKTFSFFFQFFMSCTHLISRLPQCI